MGIRTESIVDITMVHLVMKFFLLSCSFAGILARSQFTRQTLENDICDFQGGYDGEAWHRVKVGSGVPSAEECAKLVLEDHPAYSWDLFSYYPVDGVQWEGPTSDAPCYALLGFIGLNQYSPKPNTYVCGLPEELVRPPQDGDSEEPEDDLYYGSGSGSGYY